MKRAAFILLILLLSGHAQAGVCEDEAHAAEHAFGLPTDLLAAIGRVESGRRTPDGRMAAWPWSVNAAGEGHFLGSAGEAIELIHSLQARGIHSIDVGCFQVNLQYHWDAFTNLAEALDPALNAAAAAGFLKNLHHAEANWSDAIARYHSANPILGQPYLQQVLSSWGEGAMMSAPAISRVAALVRVIVPEALSQARGDTSLWLPHLRGTTTVIGGRLPVVIVPSGPRL